jgi:carboxyl-terminal processing protease
VYATITTTKAYRITGKTVQSQGVVPDISIPEPYDYSSYQEAHQPHALLPDEVFKKVYYQPFATIPLTYIHHNASERMTHLPYFDVVKDINRFVVAQKARNTAIPLSLPEFKNHFADISKALDQLDSLVASEIKTFDVRFPSAEMQRMQMDDYVHEVNNAWRLNLKHDRFLEETVNIMTDFIKITKTP